MTIEELNAIYEAADFGNQGNYKAPTTSNINLTAPAVEGITSIAPVPPIIIQNSGGNGGEDLPDPPTDPMSFGNLGIPGYNQLNMAGPVKRLGILEGLLSLPGNLIKGYMKYGPLGQVKRGIEFVKEKQRIAAENQRLADEINARDAARREKEYAAQGKSDPTDQSRAGSSGRRPGSGGNVERKDSGPDRNTDSEGTTYDSGGRQGFGYGLKDGGRIRYGKGGIVTL